MAVLGSMLSDLKGVSLFYLEPLLIIIDTIINRMIPHVDDTNAFIPT